MAGGGQKGIGGVEFAGGALILLGFIGGCAARGWVDGQQAGDPIEQHQTDCEQAWSASEAGQADDDDVVLLATDFCQRHNSAAVAEQQVEQRQELQEAQIP
jgi:hypothetical protein